VSDCTPQTSEDYEIIIIVLIMMEVVLGVFEIVRMSVHV
jgi:uncharacterized Rmd1/YagE family protein